MTLKAWIFDLDGTLADSAPDLAAAANRMRTRRGLPEVDYPLLRQTASSGARGLLGASFGLTVDSPDYRAYEKEFLADYEAHMTDRTTLFPGVPELIETLSTMPWAIVTNKHSRFAIPVIEFLGLNPQAVICGDTLPQRKPHPAPILAAATELGVPASESIYIGDDIRDIQAGAAAGCMTAAAGWGYLGCKESVEQWGADQIWNTPQEAISFLNTSAK